MNQNQSQTENQDRRPLDNVNVAADRVGQAAVDGDYFINMLRAFVSDIKEHGINVSTELLGKERTIHISFPTGK